MFGPLERVVLPFTEADILRYVRERSASGGAAAVVDEAELRSVRGVVRNPFVLSLYVCLLYTSPSPRDQRGSRMPSSA